MLLIIYSQLLIITGAVSRYGLVSTIGLALATGGVTEAPDLKSDNLIVLPPPVEVVLLPELEVLEITSVALLVCVTPDISPSPLG